MESFISPPDLLIYLRGSVPTLVKQIQARGRDYESTINIDYLSRLNERYEAFITTYEEVHKDAKLIIIDVDHNDFNTDAEDLGIIINKINAEINGLF